MVKMSMEFARRAVSRSLRRHIDKFSASAMPGRVVYAGHIPAWHGVISDWNREKLMRAAATIARHPIHPMLVPIPIGLWLFSLVCDLVYRLGPGDTVWYTVATYNLVAGIVGALAAAVFGLMDMRILPAHVKRLAKMHMTINLIVVALYLVNAWLRVRPGEYSDVPLLMSIVAVALLAVSGWLGGHMVYVHGAGVDRDETAAPQATPRQGSSRGGRHARA